MERDTREGSSAGLSLTQPRLMEVLFSLAFLFLFFFCFFFEGDENERRGEERRGEERGEERRASLCLGFPFVHSGPL